MCEIWKDIDEYDGYYQVSTLGNVRSVDIYVRCKNGIRLRKGRILSPTKLPNGYLQVTLSKNNKVKKYSVHRLVAQTFISNPNNLPCVNHKDENPKNNCVDNLEWCTVKYNINYGTSSKRLRSAMLNRYKTDSNWKQTCIDRLDIYHKLCMRPVCQLTLEDELVKVWESAASTTADGFVSVNVGNCANGKRKTHHGFKWMWLEDFINLNGGDYYHRTSSN